MQVSEIFPPFPLGSILLQFNVKLNFIFLGARSHPKESGKLSLAKGTKTSFAQQLTNYEGYEGFWLFLLPRSCR